MNTVTVTLKLRRQWADGGLAYSVDGLPGSLYIKAGLLSPKCAPETLTLTGVGLADPTAPKVKPEPKPKAAAQPTAPAQPTAQPETQAEAPKPKAGRKAKAA